MKLNQVIEAFNDKMQEIDSTHLGLKSDAPQREVVEAIYEAIDDHGHDAELRHWFQLLIAEARGEH